MTNITFKLGGEKASYLNNYISPRIKTSDRRCLTQMTGQKREEKVIEKNFLT